MNLNKKRLAALCATFLLSLAAHAGEWIADQNGCKAWNANPGPGETITWSGACQAGQASGKGTQAWFKDGQPNGKYEGEMRGGRSHGKGTYTWPDGSRYEGDWVESKRAGKGTYTWPENTVCGTCSTRYVGEWKDGKRVCGKQDYKHGDSYDGCFDKNENEKGKTKYQLAKYDQTRNCQHLYIGRAVVYDKTAWGGFLTGTVLGFSAQQGVATLKPNHSSGSEEVLCSRIEE